LEPGLKSLGDLVGSEANIYCVQALFSFFQLKGDLIILADLIDKSGNMYKILLFGFGFFYKPNPLVSLKNFTVPSFIIDC